MNISDKLGGNPKNQTWFSPTEGEEVLWFNHPSKLLLLPKLFFGLMIILFGVYSLVFDPGNISSMFTQESPVSFLNMGQFLNVIFSLIIMFFGGLMIVLNYLKWANTYYVVTNEKVIKKKGIIREKNKRIPYEHLQQVNKKFNIKEKILRIGDLELYTAGTSGLEMYWDNVPNPRKASTIIETQKEEAD